ncbi:MAG: porphobilinogen synthase [Myxococcota bacterium]
MGYPTVRLRRLRENTLLRSMVRETILTPSDFIMPLFVVEGLSGREEINSMPGQFRYSIKELAKECKNLSAEGIKAVILFGIPKHKDPKATSAHSKNGIIQNALKAVKDKVPELLLVTDVCLCEYTSHGHCGLISNGKILNDETLEILADTALSHASAGADMVAPSDMMDGRVRAIRKRLDESAFHNTPIMAYSAKYSSAYYGPFRDAAESAPSFGDRSSYQMDCGNARQALREVALDLEEGADIVMVKPALAYLDIIRLVKNRFDVPVAAYNVSGEYSMIKAAVKMGWLDEKRVILETLTAIKRAGADIILSYHSREVLKWL